MPDKRRAPAGYDATPEDYLRVLAANDMTQGVLVQPSFLGTDNSYLVASLRKYPGRFHGIVVGLDRLVWGSDWPHTLFEETVDYPTQRRLLDEWLPVPADRMIVLRETPARLFAPAAVRRST